MENEIMETVNETEMDEIVVNEGSGIGTGAAIAIGAALACAVGAGVKLVQKGIAWYKAKKELKKPDHPIEVDDEDLVEVATK